MFEYSYQSKIVKFLAFIIDAIGSIFFFWAKKEMNFNPGDKVLIAKLDHIGDGFIMLPFITALKNKGCVIDVLVPGWTKEIYENNPNISDIITYDYVKSNRKGKKFSFSETIKLIKRLKKKKYNIFIDARGEPFAAVLGFLIRVRQRIGFIGDEVGSFLYTHSIKYNKEEYEGDKYFAYKGKSILYPLGTEKKKIENIVKPQQKIIGIHMTSGLPYKIWPADNFIKLTKRIKSKYPQFVFAVLGASSDRDYVQCLVKENVKDFSGAFNLRESYYFISKCSLFIGNDSALVHFAASLDIPVVDIMNSAVSSKRWVPNGKNIHIIEGIDNSHCCKTKDCDYPCPNMLAISVDEVFNMCEKLLYEKFKS